MFTLCLLFIYSNKTYLLKLLVALKMTRQCLSPTFCIDEPLCGETYLQTQSIASPDGDIFVIYCDAIKFNEKSIGFISVYNMSEENKCVLEHKKDIELQRMGYIDPMTGEHKTIDRIYGGYGMCIFGNRWVVIGGRYDLTKIILIDIISCDCKILVNDNITRNKNAFAILVQNVVNVNGISDYLGWNENQFLVCVSNGSMFYRCQICPTNLTFSIVRVIQFQFNKQLYFTRTFLGPDRCGEIVTINDCKESYSDSDDSDCESDCSTDSNETENKCQYAKRERDFYIINLDNMTFVRSGKTSKNKTPQRRGVVGKSAKYVYQCGKIEGTNTIIANDTNMIKFPSVLVTFI